MCVRPLGSGKHGFPLRILLPLLQRALNLEGRSLIKTSYLGPSATKFLISARCSGEGLWANFHLLQEDSLG